MSRSNKSNRAPKALFSFRRNILPPLLGIVAMLAVFGLLNSQLLVAEAAYHFNKPATVVSQTINTNAPEQSTGAELQIPKLNVKAPINFSVDTTNEGPIQLALRNGVVHYDHTAVPGEKGNIVIVGHSSGQLWAPGNYKFIFTNLSKLQKDDKIIIDYKGTRYIYSVTGNQTIFPTDLSVLNQGTDAELSLITCTPVGTSKYRLVVHAVQISPKPQSDTAAPVVHENPADSIQLPGSAKGSLWQTVKSWF